jgi:hypothetical protein
MNAFTDHALADLRHAEHYAAASTASTASAAYTAYTASTAPRHAPVSAPVRHRLGALLVEAGLHLMTRSEPVSGVSSPLAR